MGPKVLINVLENSLVVSAEYLFAAWSVTKEAFWAYL